MNDTAITAKRIKTELSNHFPQTKFSVKSRVYAGGNAVDVEWTDGPSIDMVEFYSSKYENAMFDGMTDTKTYKSIDPKLNCKGTNYVFYRHNYSNEFKEKAKELYHKKKGNITSINPNQINNLQNEYIKVYYQNMEEWASLELLNEKEYQKMRRAQIQMEKQEELEKQLQKPKTSKEDNKKKSTSNPQNLHINKKRLIKADPNHIPVNTPSFRNIPFEKQMNLVAKAILQDLEKPISPPVMNYVKSHPNYPKLRVRMIIARAFAIQELREKQ